jgi:hypothetical protein
VDCDKDGDEDRREDDDREDIHYSFLSTGKYFGNSLFGMGGSVGVASPVVQ